MIGLIDATVLAVTKLRTRQIRTIVTIGISGVLFAALVGALIVFQGGFRSITAFNKNGLGSRYIVTAAPDFPLSGNWLQSKALITRAQQIYTQTIADKKAAAKKLGITYDPATEPAPTVDPDGVAGHAYLSFAAPSVQQAVQEYLSAHPSPGLPELKQVSAPYHPVDTYSSSPFTASSGTLQTMTNGLENFASASDTSSIKGSGNFFDQNQFTLMPSQLTKPFLLSHMKWTSSSDAIPLAVPYATATKLLGLTPLPSGASPTQKLQRIQQLYAKAGDVSLAACYRNTVSEKQIQDAISAAGDIAKNKNNKAYQKPNLLYGLPAAGSCGPAVVTSDTRTNDEKSLDQKQDTFNAEFGQVVQPDQQKITFDIVGLVPDQQTAPAHSAAGILQSIVGSSLAGAIAIPKDMYEQLPSVARYKDIFQASGKGFSFGPQGTNYAEFSSASAARNFIAKDSCTTRENGTCATPTKPFQLSAFGSDSIAMQDLQHKFSTFFKLAALVITAIAIVIMTGTVGRMLADSRRETAVFRAIGAKRMDIAGIYGIYTLLLSSMIAVASLALGYVVARLFDQHFWKATTVQAQLAFGGANSHQQFHFLGYSVEIWLVAGVAIAAGLVSMILPTVRNLRRNPIKDMRDE